MLTASSRGKTGDRLNAVPAPSKRAPLLQGLMRLTPRKVNATGLGKAAETRSSKRVNWNQREKNPALSHAAQDATMDFLVVAEINMAVLITELGQRR